MELKIGQSVKVKKGTEKVDGFDVSGWQGRVVEQENNGFLLVEWDSLTMKKMPVEYILSIIRQTDEEELNHCYLGVNDVEIVEERDKANDVEKVKAEIYRKYERQAFSEGSPKDEILDEIMPLLKEGEICWYEYLEENFVFPFIAVNNEGYESETEIKITGLHDEDELRGLIMVGKISRHKTYQLLCELTVKDEKSKNFALVNAYADWFTNYQED